VPLNPGDGLAFVDGSEVAGTLVNAVEGRQVFVQDPSRVKPGFRLHRNVDHRWLKALRSAKVERRLSVQARLDFPEGGVRLRFVDEAGQAGEAFSAGSFTPPKDPGAHRKALEESLSRLGDTPFVLAGLAAAEDRFVPVSRLNALRREAASALEAGRREARPRPPRPERRTPTPALRTDLDFTWNVANRAVRTFYERAGAQVLETAAETGTDLHDRTVMTTRHCVRYELGWCPVHPNPDPWRKLPEPAGTLFLQNGSTRLECHFDCARCRMELVLR
jgi:putative protease